MDIATIKLIVSLLVLSFVSRGETSVKIWRPDNDILNPRHWVGGKAQTSCDGLDLSENFASVIALNELEIKKIMLPSNSFLYLVDNAHIEFNEHSSDVANCARIREMMEVNDWIDPASWIMQDDENNVAAPHYERIPCKDDDVVFPKRFQSGHCFLEQEVEIKSLKFGEDYLKDEDFEDDVNLELLTFAILRPDLLHILDETCMDPTGCLCRNDSQFDKQICIYVDVPNFNCLNPIKPIGFCTKMCGASILVKPKINFHITSVRKSLKHYSSDTYVSKVLNGSEEVIQIIFAEKQFSGTSLDEAQDYFSQRLAEETIEARSAELYSSGPKFVDGEITRNALSIVFGSLCGVVLVFAILFLIYSPQFAALNLENRFRPLSRFPGNLFVRYDNTENAELILERHSLAGSVINLDKASDNPMYEKSTPSTASTSYGTIDITEEKVAKTEISVENPMFEINNLGGDVQGGTEENLVDLTGKE